MPYGEIENLVDVLRERFHHRLPARRVSSREGSRCRRELVSEV
jgi:hypothetical protein